METARAGRRRHQFMLTEADVAALDFLRERHFFLSRSQALRLALRDTAQAAVAVHPPSAERIRASVVNMVLKSHGGGPTGLKPWSCWLWPEQTSHIQSVQRGFRMERMAEAIRFSIRFRAEADGFIPKGGWQ